MSIASLEGVQYAPADLPRLDLVFRSLPQSAIRPNSIGPPATFSSSHPIGCATVFNEAHLAHRLRRPRMRGSRRSVDILASFRRHASQHGYGPTLARRIRRRAGAWRAVHVAAHSPHRNEASGLSGHGGEITATADAVRGSLRLLPLLTGRVELSDLTLVKPTIEVPSAMASGLASRLVGLTAPDGEGRSGNARLPLDFHRFVILDGSLRSRSPDGDVSVPSRA